MATIDPSARIETGAIVAENAVIGPYCVVGANVTIGDGCRLIAHVHVTGHTVIGARTMIYPFASLGTPPQSVRYRGGPTRLAVGADCEIREAVTMNTGTEDDRGETVIGNGCLFMVGAHVGHDCVVGNKVIFANNVALGGHVVVGDNVFFGGQAAVHQFVRVGEGAMIAGLSGIRADIIPFGYAIGQTARLTGLNVVGLRRRGHSKSDLRRLRRAYLALFFGAGLFRERVEAVGAEFAEVPEVAKIVAFIRAGGPRPLTFPRAQNDTDRADAGAP